MAAIEKLEDKEFGVSDQAKAVKRVERCASENYKWLR